MVVELLKQNLLRIRRSPEFQKRMATNIILGILIAISAINFLYISFNLNLFLRNIPGVNPLKLINEIAVVYFPIDYILRLIFQKYRSVSVKPYLILNIPREKIVDLMLIKTSQSLLNLTPLMLFLPFAFTEMILHYSIIPVIAWFLTIYFVCFANAYLANYSKIIFRTSAVKSILANGVILGLIFSVIIFMPAYFKLLSGLMESVLNAPYYCLIPLLFGFLMLRINRGFLLANLFIDEAKDFKKEAKAREKDLKDNFSFLSSAGSTGHFIRLELKMILRNKRPKPVLFMSLLFCFYGLLFYSEPINSEYLKVFIGSFMTGVFIFSYGIIIFGWESSYFSLIMAGNINFRTYLRAKYYFMAAVTTLLYLLTTFYVIFGVRILLINSAVFLFNVGITPFLMLFISCFNRMKYGLNESMFSQQGRGAQQYLGSLIVLAIQVGLFYVFEKAINFNAALIALASIGLAGIIFHNRIISLVEKFFYVNKYSMIEGFRKT